MIAKRPPAREASEGLSLAVGLAALVFSMLYLVSDLVELIQGAFSTGQLALTLMAEAAIPLYVVGLFALQRPQIGTLGLVGTVVYAYSFVFFTGTVWFALANRTSSWDELVDQLGMWMTIHGVLMILSGLAIGLAVARARVLPRWTGFALMAGMVLIAASSGLPEVAQMASAGIRDVAFAGMGASLLITAHRGARSPRSGPVKEDAFGDEPDRPGRVRMTNVRDEVSR